MRVLRLTLFPLLVALLGFEVCLFAQDDLQLADLFPNEGDGPVIAAPLEPTFAKPTEPTEIDDIRTGREAENVR